MKNISRIALSVAGVFFAAVIIYLLVRDQSIPVLQPAGIIGEQQRQLLFFALGLSLIIVIPVFTMTIFIVWRYRSTNTRARYTPDWDKNKVLETIWWGIPIILITILAIVTWQSTHKLDPFRPLESNKRPLTVQVVALEWKWLFIYPEQNIASVNYLKFPVDNPVRFQITAEAPMNSFWIPQLGGQIYAMSGMSTELQLEANEIGQYRGSSANLSGEGFSGMTFTAEASSKVDFNKWVRQVRRNSTPLSKDAYQELAEPSKDMPITSYSPVTQDLYATIILSYMQPAEGSKSKTGHGH